MLLYHNTIIKLIIGIPLYVFYNMFPNTAYHYDQLWVQSLLNVNNKYHGLIFKSADSIMQTLKPSVGTAVTKTLLSSPKKKTLWKKEICSSSPVYRLLIQQKHAALSPQRQISCVWMWSLEGWAHSAYANRFTDNQLHWKLFKQKGTSKEKPVTRERRAYREQKVKESYCQRKFWLDCVSGWLH